MGSYGAFRPVITALLKKIKSTEEGRKFLEKALNRHPGGLADEEVVNDNK